jgi:ATPase subunit of ABC transporter with duplicated ATPase domains
VEVKTAVEKFCAHICKAVLEPWQSPEELAEEQRNRKKADVERRAEETRKKAREEARERADQERREREAKTARERAEEEERRRQQAEAKRRADDEASWVRLGPSPDRDGLTQHLAEFPDGAHAMHAREMLGLLASTPKPQDAAHIIGGLRSLAGHWHDSGRPWFGLLWWNELAGPRTLLQKGQIADPQVAEKGK